MRLLLSFVANMLLLSNTLILFFKNELNFIKSLTMQHFIQIPKSFLVWGFSVQFTLSRTLLKQEIYSLIVQTVLNISYFPQTH